MSRTKRRGIEFTAKGSGTHLAGDLQNETAAIVVSAAGELTLWVTEVLEMRFEDSCLIFPSGFLPIPVRFGKLSIELLPFVTKHARIEVVPVRGRRQWGHSSTLIG